MRLYFLKRRPNSNACDSSDSAASNSAIRSCEYISTGSVTAGRKRMPSEVVSAMRLSWGRIPAACRMAAGRAMRPRPETERVICIDSIYRKAENLQLADASSAFAAVMQSESIPWMESPCSACSLFTQKGPPPHFHGPLRRHPRAGISRIPIRSFIAHATSRHCCELTN